MKPVLPAQIGIKTLYTSNFMHTTLWSFVTGQRLCGKSVNDSIRDYMQHFDVMDLEFGALKNAYYLKSKEFMKCAGEFSKDAKECFDTTPDEVTRVTSKIAHLINSVGK